jgi:hypothetical protein
MTSGYQVVLDACVLVNAALRDTLLRLSEPPHLYLPRWSSEIIREMMRTMENKLGVTASQSAHLLKELQDHFPEAWVEGYEALIPIMGNDVKDRHVLAAAVRTGAQTIVSFNLKHFPTEALAKWNVTAQSPDEFLVHQFHLNQATVIAKVREQISELRGGSVERLLSIHGRTAPGFTELLRPALAGGNSSSS